MPGISTEQQIELVSSILRSLSSTAWTPQGGLRSVLPCSYAELDAWTRRMPNREVQATLAAALRSMPLLESMAGFDPNALDGLSSIERTDPRVPAFMARLRESWPPAEQVDGIRQLWGCLARILEEMIAARPQMPNDSPLAKALDDAASKRDATLPEIANQLASLSTVFDWVSRIQPGVTHTLAMTYVHAPEINLLFDLDGKILVREDFVSRFTLSGTTGSGLLQSRTWPPGEPGTQCSGLTAYLYRIALNDLVGDPARHGVKQFAIEFSGAESVHYGPPGVGSRSQVFVITAGGLGSVAPTAITERDGLVTFTFDHPVRAGRSPGSGEGSYFFGLVSRFTPRSHTAKLVSLTGEQLPIESRAP